MTLGTTVNIGSKPQPVTLSDVAITKVAALLSEEEGGEALALRVAVKAGGCSGFSYDMFFDSEIASDDIVTTFGTVRVVVDPASAEKLVLVKKRVSFKSLNRKDLQRKYVLRKNLVLLKRSVLLSA